MRPGVPVFLALLIVTAGCVSTVPGSTSTGTDRLEPPEREGTEFSVEIREVIDGDRMVIGFSDGTTETVRLLGVDTPEVNAGSQPEEFEGIPDTEAGHAHLRTWGERATEFAKSRLEPGESVRIVDETADRRGGYGRLFDTRFEKRSTFAETESGAMANTVGLWGFGESG